MPYYGYYYDPTYVLVIIGAILCMIASAHVKATYRSFARIPSEARITGAQIATQILQANGLSEVSVTHVRGELTDHFDPRNMTVNLSDTVYGSTSVAAIAVAAHECGHVLQHQNAYLPYRLRHALVPIANFGSSAAWILIIAGVALGFGANSANSNLLVQLGIYAFGAAVLFQIVTLPVELNASRRALKILTSSGQFSREELHYQKKVLRAAALTYIAGAAAAILQLLRIILIFGGGRRND